VLLEAVMQETSEGNPDSDFLDEAVHAIKNLYTVATLRTFQNAMGKGPTAKLEWHNLVTREQMPSINKHEAKRQSLVTSYTCQQFTDFYQDHLGVDSGRNGLCSGFGVDRLGAHFPSARFLQLTIYRFLFDHCGRQTLLSYPVIDSIHSFKTYSITIWISYERKGSY
jgi:hypothetical protein